jgi:uncharacterized protein (TIGR02147 family)
MANIFEYTDYRKYLADYYQEKKAAKRSFSYNSFSLKAGFKNKGFLYHVIHGKKNLSKVSVIKISQAIKHKRNEAEYFENLVFFNQASDLKERNYFYEKLSAVKSRDKSAIKILRTRKEHYEFYSTWYNSAVRSLIDMYPFKDEYEWLAKNVYPPITLKQAKKSVELLKKLGLIKKQNNGVYKLTDKNISAGKEVLSLAALNFHKETAGLADNAISNLPKDRRNLSGLTLGTSQKTYENICKEIEAFRARIVEMVNSDDGSDRVYQMNLHLFPMSKTDIKRNK